jgi:hypothetical protein
MKASMTASPPWAIHPALTAERLRAVARIIQLVRNEALEDYDPDRGDGPWSFGCRVYERTCFEITRAAQGEYKEWLEVIEQPLHFVFGVGGVPVRFYHGEDDRPNARSLRMRAPEIEAVEAQLELFQEYGQTNSLWPWRMVVVSDEDGSVLRVVMVQLDPKGYPRNPWTVPLPAEVVPFAPVAAPPTEGVALPPPRVTAKYPDTQAQDQGASKTDGGE